MDPRISARRTAVIREQGRRRLVVAGVALGVALLVVGGWFLLHTPLFSARSVTVTGNVHETAAQVVAQAGLADRPPLLDVNGARCRRPPGAAPVGALGDGARVVARRRPHRRDRGDAALHRRPRPAGQWESLSNDGRVLERVARPARPGCCS